MEDISKNITWCNLCLHGRFLQTWSHFRNYIISNSATSDYLKLVNVLLEIVVAIIHVLIKMTQLVYY